MSHLSTISLVLGTETMCSVDLSFDIVHYEEVSQRICPDCKQYHGREGTNVDNQAIAVMIGEDPYTLRLFDTAGLSH